MITTGLRTSDQGAAATVQLVRSKLTVFAPPPLPQNHHNGTCRKGAWKLSGPGGSSEMLIKSLLPQSQPETSIHSRSLSTVSLVPGAYDVPSSVTSTCTVIFVP
jgi:hypothetical protein